MSCISYCNDSNKEGGGGINRQGPFLSDFFCGRYHNLIPPPVTDKHGRHGMQRGRFSGGREGGKRNGRRGGGVGGELLIAESYWKVAIKAAKDRSEMLGSISNDLMMLRDT